MTKHNKELMCILENGIHIDNILMSKNASYAGLVTIDEIATTTLEQETKALICKQFGAVDGTFRFVNTSLRARLRSLDVRDFPEYGVGDYTVEYYNENTLGFVPDAWLVNLNGKCPNVMTVEVVDTHEISDSQAGSFENMQWVLDQDVGSSIMLRVCCKTGATIIEKFLLCDQ